VSTEALHYVEWTRWLEKALHNYTHGYTSLNEDERILFGNCLLINRHRMKRGEAHFCEESSIDAGLPSELVQFWWRLQEAKTPIKHVVCDRPLPPSYHDILCAVSWVWFEEER
jgi:hypothetical protein